MKRQARSATLMALFGFALLSGSLRAQGNFVYINNNIAPVGANTVSGFSVTSTGTLTPVPGSPFATGGSGLDGVFGSASNISVSNVGNFLFVSNTASNTVSVFSINASTGTLTPVAGSPFATGGSGLVVALSPTPDGMFLIAANTAGPVSLPVLSIASSGALTPIAGSPFPALSSPDGIKVSPDGKFLAVAEPFANQVEMFRIASNGSLTSLGAFPGGGGVGFSLSAVDIDCTTSLLYGAEVGGANAFMGSIVDGYSMSSNGALTPVPGSPLFPGLGPLGVVLLNPNDNTLFVSTPGVIAVFSVASNGSLLSVAGSPFVSRGAFHLGMATSQDGSVLYTADRNASISVFSVASNGALTEVAGSPFPTGQAGVPQSLAAFPPKSCRPAPVMPTITSISPGSAIAGGAAFTLTVNGTNFVNGSTVNFNGNARTTTFVSATQLTVAIVASDIAIAGNFNVTVTNPGDGTSNAVSFTVVTPQDATGAIINSVNVLFSQGVINGGQDNSLVVQLQHAISMMNAGKNAGAIGNLDSFISEVNDLLSSGVLSPSQAASLVSAAQSVIAALP